MNETRNEAMNEAMNEMTSGPLPRMMAHELASAYEATNEVASDDVVPEVVHEAAPIEVPTVEDTSDATSTANTPPINDVRFHGLRLRMKVWTDRTTNKRYLMPSAFMRDVVRGQPVTDVMYAYAMRDDDTKIVTLTAVEWNALPFFYFNEDGPAPRATSRPVDMVVSSERSP
jgi:hypothetical protein